MQYILFSDLPVHESRLDERVLDQAPEGHLAAGLGVNVSTSVADSLDAHLRHCEEIITLYLGNSDIKQSCVWLVALCVAVASQLQTFQVIVYPGDHSGFIPPVFPLPHSDGKKIHVRSISLVQSEK